MLGKEVEEVRNSSEEVIAGLKERIERLIQAKKDLANDHAVAVRRCRRLQEAKKLLKKRMEERSHKHPTIFRMMHRGRYTPAARKLARLMVSAGAAETRVGEAPVEIGKTLGIQVSRRINKRTVQRIMLEQGVAADILSGQRVQPVRGGGRHTCVIVTTCSAFGTVSPGPPRWSHGCTLAASFIVPLGPLRTQL